MLNVMADTRYVSYGCYLCDAISCGRGDYCWELLGIRNGECSIIPRGYELDKTLQHDII